MTSKLSTVLSGTAIAGTNGNWRQRKDLAMKRKLEEEQERLDRVGFLAFPRSFIILNFCIRFWRAALEPSIIVSPLPSFPFIRELALCIPVAFWGSRLTLEFAKYAN